MYRRVCSIINGDIPSYKVYEDDDFLAFLDISQAELGHTLVIPKKHFDNFLEMDDKTAKELIVLVKKIANSVKLATNAKGINILNNNGLAAGQSVNHIHFHIIPRYDNDDLIMKFTEHKLQNDEFISLQEKIKKGI